MASLVANGTYLGRTVLVRHSAGLAMAETQYGAGMVVPQDEHETALCVLVLEGGFEEHSERQREMCVTGTLQFVPAGASYTANSTAEPATRRWRWTSVRWKPWARWRRTQSGSRSTNAARNGCIGPAITSTRTSARRSPSCSFAHLTGVHPAYLSRAFRRHTGETLSGLVRRLRLEHATERLVRDGACIGLIGLEAGFADHSHFTRAFKRATGTTPQAYRELFSPPRARPDPRQAPLP